jgi:NADH:ubiquinone oxidoreductase subunit 5 (subunit L)/multisubunit Na+/H+ antiporter MnhA subunit
MLDRLAMLVPLLPFLAAALIGLPVLCGRPWAEKYERPVARLSVLAMSLSLLVAAGLFASAIANPAPRDIVVAPWLESGAYQVPLELLVDPLSAALALLVTCVGALTAKFSRNYMHRESGYARFYAVLCLFIASMLLLVMGGNLVMTFMGWEGAGLCSYLLVGFYYDRKASASAATYVFVTNRIGDAGFIAGIFVAFGSLGTVRYTELFARAHGASTAALTAMGLCLLVAAAAKSAQLPFSPWISRAIIGPTPSSAIFYGSVMVTAGPFLVLRLHPVLDLAPDALRAMAAMGAATALYGCVVSLVQTDVKSGLIASTVGQLGMMFLAAGLGARTIAIFHLFAHAVLRALQFLTAPSAMLNIPRAAPTRDEKPVAGEIDPAFWLLLAGLLGVLGLPFVAEIWAGPEMHLAPSAFLLAAGVGMALFCGGHYLSLFARQALASAGENKAEAATRKGIAALTDNGTAWIAPGLVGAVGLAISLSPAESPEAIFNAVLGPLMGKGPRGPAAHPFWAFGLLLLLGALLVSGWATALYFHRAAPERPGILPARLRRLYVTALSRFWLEPLYRRVLITPIERLGRALDRLDASLLDRAMGRPLAPESAPAPLAAFQEKLLEGEIDDGDPFAAVRAALERASQAGLPAPPPAPELATISEEEFARGRGVAGRLLQWAASLAHMLERHVVGRAIGRGIPVTGDMLGRALNHVEELLERPVVVGALMAISLFAAVRWIG